MWITLPKTHTRLFRDGNHYNSTKTRHSENMVLFRLDFRAVVSAAGRRCMCVLGYICMVLAVALASNDRKMNNVPRGFCFILIFTLAVSHGSFACQGVRYTRQEDHQLLRHVIKTVRDQNEPSCLWQCKLTPNCFSVNSYRGRQQRWHCELNSSSKKSDLDDLIARDGSTYIEIQRLDDCSYKQGINTHSGIYKEALPGGWFHFNASFFKAFWEKRIRWKARQTCKALHGDLASIRSEHENEFIREVFRMPQWNQQHNDSCETWKTEKGNRCVFPFVYQGKLHEFCINNYTSGPHQSWCSITKDFDRDSKWGFCKENPVQKLWLGLKYNNESGNFTWVDGSSTSYENWGAQGRGQCVLMTEDGTWKTIKCAHKFYFVCEKN